MVSTRRPHNPLREFPDKATERLHMKQRLAGAFRLFARRTSGTWGVMNVKLRFKEANGAVNETVVGSVSAGDTAWHPTAPIALSTVLSLWNADQSASVQLVFDPEDTGGAWAIDDVYIDPYSKS